MSALYLSQQEMSAIKEIDVREAERCVKQALDRVNANALYDLQLSGCGQHITDQLRRYERDLANYAKAKAARKRAETRSRAWSSGHDVVYPSDVEDASPITRCNRGKYLPTLLDAR